MLEEDKSSLFVEITTAVHYSQNLKCLFFVSFSFLFQDFDAMYGIAWHCIVGKSYGSLLARVICNSLNQELPHHVQEKSINITSRCCWIS
jgi:hypothetical protein